MFLYEVSFTRVNNVTRSFKGALSVRIEDKGTEALLVIDTGSEVISEDMSKLKEVTINKRLVGKGDKNAPNVT